MSDDKAPEERLVVIQDVRMSLFSMIIFRIKSFIASTLTIFLELLLLIAIIMVFIALIT